MDFTCNICGKLNTGVEDFGREVPNCSECRSTVRMRALIYALSQELFGATLQLRDFPVLKSVRCLGLTDSHVYAPLLAKKFDYKNTFFDQEPRLDITDIEGLEEGVFDLIISSEVFEHVRPPFEKALENSSRLLKPNGVLILSLPYHLDDWPSMEHFPELADFGLAQLRSGMVLVNRTAEGKLQVFENILFHGGSGSTVEMRMLNEEALRRAILSAGFTGIQFYGEDSSAFGIRHAGSWSLPLAARKQPFEFTAPLRAEVFRSIAERNGEFRTEIAQVRKDLAQLHAQHLELQTKHTELNHHLEARTEWARQLDEDLKETRATVAGLQAELESRTKWAHELDVELARCSERAVNLANELESRSKWALDLNALLDERTQWAQQLDARAKRLEGELAAIRASWWTRVGRRLRLVP